ncbi:YciI family protein [Ancylobacter sp. 6x-1]|uniref:YciI family protein n=1 Tax=Ancylobacter crimeensis TaxID=2579147 RepID=A0ABT0DCG1_9HYPH|nr:YciI family protein [Ancylobacter crimeensis]MCK0197630.1 YciI family protein [Ancylobacter crimeensis]
MQFVLTAYDRADGLALRAQTRPAHLDYLRANAASIAFAGPMLDGEGKPRGSIIVYEAPDLASAETLAAADPYAEAGLFAKTEISGFRTVVKDGVVAG